MPNQVSEELAKFGIKMLSPEEMRAESRARLKDRRRQDREIKRELDAEERGVADDLTLLTESELLDEAPADELIDGLIVQGSLFMLFGPKNLGKTFLTIAMAYAVVLGRLFLGLKVRRSGPVVLVLAEGGSRLGLRFGAWRAAHAITAPVEGLHIVKRPVNLTDAPAIDAFIARIQDLHPVLVIFDTLSRSGARRR